MSDAKKTNVPKLILLVVAGLIVAYFSLSFVAGVWSGISRTAPQTIEGTDKVTQDALKELNLK